jgi:DNA polymerase-3 subunit delta'
MKGGKMALQDILGQERAIRVLHQALAHDRVAQAYLFYGPSGTGKKLTAVQFTKALYCASASADACDHCVSCSKIDAGNHPDILTISAEGPSIGIEHIRTVQHHLSYRPYEQQRITVIVDGCELLTAPAANALLKTLEEPPECALLILLTGKKAALPLTLTSRCQLVPFQPLSPAHMQAIFVQQGLDETEASLAATLSEGRLDAFAHGDFAQALAIRDQAHRLLSDLVHSRAVTPFLQARKLAGKREQCDELLRWLGLLCRDLTMLKTTPTRNLYNHDLRRELTELVLPLPVKQLLEAFAHIEQQRYALGMNLNPQLVFEHVLLHLQHLLTTEQS